MIDLDKTAEILERLQRVEAAVAGIGHNAGPPLDEPGLLGLLPDRLVAERYDCTVRTLEKMGRETSTRIPAAGLRPSSPLPRDRQARGHGPRRRTRSRRPPPPIRAGQPRKPCPAPALGASANPATLRSAETGVLAALSPAAGSGTGN